MRDRHYKLKGFRLDDITLERLEKLKEKSGASWNLVFMSLLNLEKQYGLDGMVSRAKK